MNIPVIGFAAPSGTGKTTLMERVIAELSHEGYRVGAIKHGHHPADPDQPGKDTHRFRQAGARSVLFACPQRWFMIQELHPGEEPELEQQVRLFLHHDLVIVEGYKNYSHPKIAIHRQGVTDPGYIKSLANCVAIATDDPGLQAVLGPSPPLLALNEPLVVSRFIRHHLALADLVSA
ncbi:MAG: molybdopterin guanine dinucleotide biosynthesis accessory protein MobB [Magnetococcales bacterium]|nr:molybdopterin guanine dinucleotide biosynthesis accessory protein MobB [Magnetococcales bacterium]HIJ84941.1 molybdopterin-guanine dinucleotide biosynthesis protein B [Magnetococcales bacterium]